MYVIASMMLTTHHLLKFTDKLLFTMRVFTCETASKTKIFYPEIPSPYASYLYILCRKAFCTELATAVCTIYTVSFVTTEILLRPNIVILILCDT